jgi:hypothetical protein
MNRYILIRRLTGPAVLLLLGTVALLHEAHLVSWNIFVPLLLILIGLLKLAQRAALAAADDEPMLKGAYQGQYPGSYPGAPYQYSGAGAPQTPPQPGATSASTPPAQPGGSPEEGQS